MSEEPSPTPFTAATEDLLRELDMLEIPSSVFPSHSESPSPSTPTPTSTSTPTTASSLSSSTVSGGTMERHPEFWFFDGSIVLVAERVMFRVHKAFLARHSVFFRDMFSLPQPKEDQDPSSSSTGIAAKCDSSRPVACKLGGDLGEIEGCPTLRLHDSPDDVASLLYALYDGPKFGNNDKADFRVVSGILRLASKYIIESLRVKALEHLSIAWPSTLKGWDAREEKAGDWYVGSDEPRFYPNPVEVINLAREIDAPNLLLSAFYDLSRYPLSDIFDLGTSQPGEGGSSPKPDVSLRQLSLSDTQKLVLGKEATHYAVTALIRSMATEARSNPVFTHHHNHVSPHAHHPLGALGGIRGGGGARGQFAARHRRAESGPIHRCSSPAACWRDVCELVDLATQHYMFDRERGAMDPLYVAEELAMLKGSDALTPAGANAAGGIEGGEDAFGEGGTCKACARAFEVWARKERERLWKSIPGWFRLD